MTVTTQQPFVGYSGDGITTTYAYPFRILDDDHLFVFFNGVLQPSGDYTVIGEGDQTGGDVIFGVPPALGIAIDIVRRVPIDQQVDYRPFEAFPAETHEFALDKLTMMIQGLSGTVGGAIRVPENELPLNRNTILPAIPARAGQFVTFDELGNVAVSSGFTSTKNYISNATGDAQPTVHQAWNAQANAAGTTRLPNEAIFYRWPSASNDVYRYMGNQQQPPWVSTAGEWALTNTGVFIPVTEKGQPNGVATLDGTGKVPLSQLPAGLSGVFPVGAIYITATLMNPGTFIGGTWIQIGQGRVLLGVGTLGPDIYTPGQVGGVTKHQLVPAEIPFMNANVPSLSIPPLATSFSYPSGSNMGFDNRLCQALDNTGNLGTINVSGNTVGGATSPGVATVQGGDQPHENRQPYLAVFFWQRTA